MSSAIEKYALARREKNKKSAMKKKLQSIALKKAEEEAKQAQREKRNRAALKDITIESISSRKDFTVLSIEHNYILVAKKTNLLIRTVNENNPYMPFAQNEEKEVCILSIIEFGGDIDKECEEEYEKLTKKLACRVFSVTNKKDIPWIIKSFDEV